MILKKSLADSYAEAMQAYDEGRVDAARRLGKKLVEAYPQFGGAHYLLGLLAHESEQLKSAQFHLSRAIALNPHEPAPRLIMASVLQETGKVEQAASQLETILATHPDHAEAHARLGALVLDLGQDQQAIQHFEQALAQHPDWSAVLNNLGLAQGRLGLLDQAVTSARAAVEISPEHVGFRINLAMALEKRGTHGEALRQAMIATEADPDNEDGWLALGLIHKAMGALPQAVQAFGNAPSVLSAHWCRAEALREMGETGLAIGAYQHCLQMDPDDHHGARLGLALLQEGAAPDKAPQAYVRQLFDDFADDFERCLVEGLEYRAPQLIAQALIPLISGRTDLEIVDLGCGTGLAAPLLRPHAKRLDGIDLSPGMIEKARAKALYDGLIVGDVSTIPHGPYDLAVAADVLVYVGDLSEIMNAVYQALKPGGLFAFTVEALATQEAWRIGLKSRYAHSDAYIQKVSQDVGFKIKTLDAVSSRTDAGVAVPGYLVVVQHG